MKESLRRGTFRARSRPASRRCPEARPAHRRPPLRGGVEQPHGRWQRMVVQTSCVRRSLVTGDVHYEMRCGVRINLECSVRPQTYGKRISDDLVVAEIEVRRVGLLGVARIESNPVHPSRDEVDDCRVAGDRLRKVCADRGSHCEASLFSATLHLLKHDPGLWDYLIPSAKPNLDISLQNVF